MTKIRKTECTISPLRWSNNHPRGANTSYIIPRLKKSKPDQHFNELLKGSPFEKHIVEGPDHVDIGLV